MRSSDLSRRYQIVRGMVVDYAIGIAIIGLNPFRNLLTPMLLIAAAVMIKMVWDIGRKWRFVGNRNPLAIASFLLNLLGALALGLMAWITFIFAGAFVPVVDRFALAAALMTVTWTVGSVTNQFFLNSCLSIDAPMQTEETYG